MWSDRVVITPPAFDNDPSLTKRVKDFAIEKLIAQSCIEALNEAILPRAAGRDISRLTPDSLNPLSNSDRDELWAIIRTDMFRNASKNEQI